MDRTPHYIKTYLYFLETVGKLQQETWADVQVKKVNLSVMLNVFTL